MPRPINISTRIGQLRALLGLDAKTFANLAGISLSMLQKCEQGIERISRTTAERLGFATLVDPEWLLGKGRDNKPTRFDLESGTAVPLTRDAFEARTRKNPDGPLDPFLKRVHEAHGLKVVAALRTAERHGLLGPSYYLLNQFLKDLVDRLAGSKTEAKRIRATYENEWVQILAEDSKRRRTLEGSAE